MTTICGCYLLRLPWCCLALINGPLCPVLPVSSGDDLMNFHQCNILGIFVFNHTQCIQESQGISVSAMPCHASILITRPTCKGHVGPSLLEVNLLIATVTVPCTPTLNRHASTNLGICTGDQTDVLMLTHFCPGCLRLCPRWTSIYYKKSYSASWCSLGWGGGGHGAPIADLICHRITNTIRCPLPSNVC